MKLVKTLRLMYRRKLAILPVLLIGFLLFGAAYKAAPPSYRATGSIILLTPSPSSTGTGSSAGKAVTPFNPYLDFGTLSPVVDVLARRLNTSAVVDDLHAQGLKGGYTVGANISFYHGPIIDISSKANTASDSLQAVLLVMKEAGAQLAAVQAEQRVAAPDFITSAAVVTPNRATKVVSATVRTLLAVGLLDVLALIGAAYLAEGLASRRAARRQAGTVTEPAQSTEGELPLMSLTWTRRSDASVESSRSETLL